jgi:hypothetical protein
VVVVVVLDPDLIPLKLAEVEVEAVFLKVLCLCPRVTCYTFKLVKEEF